MKIILFGIRTPHEKGAFCKRVVSTNFFISYFETPFLYERNGQLVRGNPGDMMILSPSMPVYHGPVPESEEGFINDWVWLCGEELNKLLHHYPLPVGTAFPVGRHSILRRYIGSVRQELSAHMPGYEDQLKYLTGHLIIELYRINRGNQPRLSSFDRIEHARAEIMGSPEKLWTLEQMAMLSGYSVSRFSALYKTRFGCSPKQDLLDTRIDLAARMLKYTNATVTEAAYACGFQTIYYFSKYFKAAKGVSPKQYAKKD